jgi:hypothetical protein
MDHKPCVFLWYAKHNRVEPYYLPVREDAITREHIQSQEEREERIEAFVDRLNQEYAIGLSFQDNLKAFFQENNVRDSVKDIIWKAIEK